MSAVRNLCGCVIALTVRKGRPTVVKLQVMTHASTAERVVFKTAKALIQALTPSRNLSILCLMVEENMHLLIKSILLLLRTRQSSLQT